MFKKRLEEKQTFAVEMLVLVAHVTFYLFVLLALNWPMGTPSVSHSPLALCRCFWPLPIDQLANCAAQLESVAINCCCSS